MGGGLRRPERKHSHKAGETRAWPWLTGLHGLCSQALPFCCCSPGLSPPPHQPLHTHNHSGSQRAGKGGADICNCRKCFKVSGKECKMETVHTLRSLRRKSVMALPPGIPHLLWTQHWPSGGSTMNTYQNTVCQTPAFNQPLDLHQISRPNSYYLYLAIRTWIGTEVVGTRFGTK